MQTDPEAANKLAASLGCSALLAKILLNRDPALVNPERAREFLEPPLKNLRCPFEIQGMEEVVARLWEAIEKEQKVLVFGDYDVDGVTSTVALVHFLKRWGLFPDFIVPRRMEEGYGLSTAAVERALKDHGVPDLFMALDCGTNSAGAVRVLRDQGADVAVIDHHQELEDTRVDCFLINPHIDHAQEDPPPPWLNLSTAGLVFKLIHAVVKHSRRLGHPRGNAIRVADYLDLAGMGTVADLVQLRDENRLIARHGLTRLTQSRRPGVHALFQASGIESGDTLNTADISFKLGPRINAVGRLDDACIPVELLLGEDIQRCRQLAGNLESLNEARKRIEAAIFDEALLQIEQEGLEKLEGIVVYQPEWHHGVVGIVASRLTQALHRPCLVLGSAESGEAELLKGSGRSIPGVDLVEALGRCESYLLKWGGHPMAVGLTLSRDQIPALRSAFSQAVSELNPNGLPKKNLEIADWLAPEAIGPQLLRELDRLQPFGQGNPRPLMGIRPVTLFRAPKRIKNKHFRFSLDRAGEPSLGGIAWNLADRIPPLGQPLEMAARLTWNQWRGKRSLQLELIDWRPAS